MFKEEYEDVCIKLIRKLFEDERKVKGFAPENYETNNIENYDLLITENKELILLCNISEDITNKKILELIEIGERLYEKSMKWVSIYLVCEPEIKIPENIENFQSEAKIILKIAKMSYSDVYLTLDHIKEKVKQKKELNDEDLFILSMIPSRGPKYDRRFLRRECLKIWREISGW